jgi:hypothetical protein
VVVFGTTLAVAAAAAAMATRRIRRWNSDSERIQREKYRHMVATTLVGPNPQWLPIVQEHAPPTEIDNDNFDNNNNNEEHCSKKNSPQIKMLTTFYQNISCSSSSSSSSSTGQQQAKDHPSITAVIIHGFG